MSQSNNVVAWVILGYLCSHPHAKDTAAGIREWWLCGDEIHAGSGQVRATLDYLVEQGWLTSVTGVSGSTVYGLNQERLQILRSLFPS